MKTILQHLDEKNKDRNDPKHEHYWSIEASYEDAFHDCETLIWEAVGDYQGDYFVLVKGPDGRYGFTVIGYGSCSGCDGLQATTGYGEEPGEPRNAKVKEVAEYLQRDRDAVHWEDTKEAMKRYLETECDREMKETYISNEEQKRTLWPRLVAAVS